EDAIVDRVTQPRTVPFLTRFGREGRSDGRPGPREKRPGASLDSSPMGKGEPFSSMRFFDWSLEAMRQPAFPGQDVLSDDARTLSSVLHAMGQAGQGRLLLPSWMRVLTPMDVTDIEFPADPTGKVLASLVERNKRRTSLASASDGTLRFLALLAAILGP